MCLYVIYFFCLCPLGLTIKLNLNVPKVISCLDLFSTPICNLSKKLLKLPVIRAFSSKRR